MSHHNRHQIQKFHPYETGRIPGHKIALNITPAILAWRDELCFEEGVQPDNKIMFELLSNDGSIIYVQFWDGVMYIKEEEEETDKLKMKCDTCQNNIFDFPTREDPLACPHCAAGHWNGIAGKEPKQDPWETCPDYKARRTDHE